MTRRPPHTTTRLGRSLWAHCSHWPAEEVLEAYSKLYYKDKVQDGVHAELNKVPKDQTLNVVCRELQSVYDKESDEVKASVSAYVQAKKAALAAPSPASSSTVWSPAEYQR